jgi:molecular chaperone HscB
MTDSENPFAVFGAPPRLAADDAALERRFYARSLELHPDRVGREGRDAALARAAALNDAYRAIKDLPSRAKAWLETRGVALESERGVVPGAAAMRGFEIQEAAEEAAGGAVEARARLAELAQEVARDRADVAARLKALAAEEPAEPDAAFVARVRAVVVEMNYLARQAAQLAAATEDA